MECRIARSREWTTRLLHELQSWDSAQFVTLTYDTEHLPSDSGLHKDDLQKFMKRLRKELDYDQRKIRYFGCGEYGDLGDRPHYHLIIFGLGLKKADQDLVKSHWKNGFVKIGTVTEHSCRYVTDYILKKYSGKKQWKRIKANSLPSLL